MSSTTGSDLEDNLTSVSQQAGASSYARSAIAVDPIPTPHVKRVRVFKSHLQDNLQMTQADLINLLGPRLYNSLKNVCFEEFNV